MPYPISPITQGLQNKINTPVGTVAQLERDGIDPAVVPSCARQGDGVRGCRHFGYCEMAYKGKSGPQYHGVLSVPLGGA